MGRFWDCFADFQNILALPFLCIKDLCLRGILIHTFKTNLLCRGMVRQGYFGSQQNNPKSDPLFFFISTTYKTIWGHLAKI
jgi:hypothetical protein